MNEKKKGKGREGENIEQRGEIPIYGLIYRLEIVILPPLNILLAGLKRL